MGWETAVSSAFNAFSTNNQLKTAEANANAVTTSGDYQVQNIADNTVRQAGTVQSSFLQGGISLQGGPQQVLQQIYAKGNTDIARTATNSNNQASNIVNAARTSALNNIAQQFMRSTGGTSGISSSLNDLFGGSGQTAPAATGGGVNSVAATGLPAGGQFLDPTPVSPYGLNY